MISQRASIRNVPWTILVCACSALLMLSGCCPHCGRLFCDSCADITPGAIPPPPGSHTCAWQTTQAAMAERDDFVIYQYEWVGETTEPSPFGLRHLAGLVPRLQTQPCQVVIQPSENQVLDADRRIALVGLLAAQGLPDADAQVVIGYPMAEGLNGQEAPRLSQGYLRGGARSGGLGNSGSFGTSGSLGTTGGSSTGMGVY